MLFTLKVFIDALFFPIYLLRGKKPWALGYYTAKKTAINKGMDIFLRSKDKNLPDLYGINIDERVIEYPWVFSNLSESPGKILDAGSALNHDFLLNRLPLSKADLTIMTLAPEKRCFWLKSISYVFGDLRVPFFAESTFDVVISVSTIEHIGLDNTLLYTADNSKNEWDSKGFVPAVIEFKRVVKKGGLCLITVPFGKAGVHKWYQVFNQDLVNKIIETFSPVEFSVDYYGYSKNGWKKSDAESLANAEFFDVHEHKTLAEDFAAGARGVACIRMVS